MVIYGSGGIYHNALKFVEDYGPFYFWRQMDDECREYGFVSTNSLRTFLILLRRERLIKSSRNVELTKLGKWVLGELDGNNTITIEFK